MPSSGAIVDFGRGDVWVEGYSLFRVGLISRDVSDAVANFKEQTSLDLLPVGSVSGYWPMTKSGRSQTRFSDWSCVPRLLVLLFGLYVHSLSVHTRSDLPLLIMYRNRNACPDCGRTFKTLRVLAVHRHSCPKEPPRAPYSADYGDIENASEGQYQYKYLDIEGKLILRSKHVLNAVDWCTRLASPARFTTAMQGGLR
jgi:hypothetical protein